MLPRPSLVTDRVLVRPLVAAMALLAVGAVFADDDPNPYYIGAVAEYGHDSNVKQARKGSADVTADSYTGLGLVAGLDQPISRQRLFASAKVNSRRYQDVSELNHVSYDLAAGIDWATVERLTGTFNVALNQDLRDPKLDRFPLADKVLVNGQSVSLRAQYGLVSLLSLEGTLSHSNIDYSAPTIVQPYYNTLAIRQDSASIGLKYRPSGALTLGTALRFNRGTQDNKDYNRRDIDFTGYWVASGQSAVTGRISLGKQTYDNTNSALAWSGATGSLAWSYRPTGKLTFDTSLSRDTGTSSDQGDNSKFTSALSVKATYAATAKIRMTAAARYARRTIVEPPLSGSDASKSLSLTTSYQATRNWLLSCNVARNTRGAPSDTVATDLSYRYASNAVGCSAQFVIQ